MFNIILSKGYNFEPNEPCTSKSIGYICKRIVAFWTRYDRKKSSIVQCQYDWLNVMVSIVLKSTKNSSQEIAESAHRGRRKVDFAESYLEQSDVA